eukprot:355767-Chlamydomonas_euryale.AAC.4
MDGQTPSIWVHLVNAMVCIDTTTRLSRHAQSHRCSTPQSSDVQGVPRACTLLGRSNGCAMTPFDARLLQAASCWPAGCCLGQTSIVY